MSCREFWSRMPELEFGEWQLDHLRQCPACAALLEKQRAVAAGLRQLAANRSHLDAPLRVQNDLQAAFRNRVGMAVPPPTGWRGMHSWRWASAAAAGLVLAGLLSWSVALRPGHKARPQVVQYAPVEAAAADFEAAGFIPLPGAMETLPDEDADLVRVQVPRSVLLDLGVPLGESSGDAVEAEVLLGAGGAPQAVRILQ